MPYLEEKLTEKVKTSGCAAKFPASQLRKILSSLPVFSSDKLLSGFEDAEDSAVYKINDNLSIVQTVDFFPPMVDDAYDFGQIAAANALSDVYAMGAEPSLALSLLCFPSCMNREIMKNILKGGVDKCKEAGVVIAGGHTIADEVPKYGLCVTGFADPDKIWYNNSVREGDCLVLTKKIGAGVINTAIKAGEASEQEKCEVITSMKTLNKKAKDAALSLDVSACTDVTGFGLLGHLGEMMSKEELSAEIYTEKIPFFANAVEYASIGLIPEGMYNNMEYVADRVDFAKNISQPIKDLLFDPQTSGGLLFSIGEKDLEKLLKNYDEAVFIGKITKKGKKPIIVL